MLPASSRRCRLTLWMAAGPVALLAVTLTVSQARQSHPTPIDTAHKVADALDCMIQPRFQINMGRFGLERVEIDGHDDIYTLKANTAYEKKQLAIANASGRVYWVGFLHCAHKPGKYVDSKNKARQLDKPHLVDLLVSEGKEPQYSEGGDEDGWIDKSYNVVRKVAFRALPELKQGKQREVTTGGWLVVMRPVRALKKECMSCHTGAKQGDTLGVMVYAVQNQTVRKGKPATRAL